MPSRVLLCGGVLGCFACHDVRELLVDHGSSMRMSSRSMRAGAIALAAVMMSSMVACSGPSASEKASASFHNSVSAARDALFEEAKATNQGFFDLEESLLLQGGTQTPPPDMSRFVMGEFADDVSEHNAIVQRESLRTRPDTKAALIGPRIYTGPDKPEMADAREQASIIIESCTDSTSSPIVDRNNHVVENGGGIAHHIFFLRKDVDNNLKIFVSWTGKVETCPVTA
ncbi:hypothetical protein ACWPM6_05990 [Propionibacterium freudenreichii]|uniref:hypothetical protein n=2 Tax=Propionibacterium freudenreichii TaxID=1744 RepID=UPI001E3959E6|nr:hypothetical protein [Propionibacterium freudenreichii]